MSRLTIYERLKPEIKEALHSSENDKYKASIDNIVEALSSTTFYSDLKISDVSSLYTFSNLELIRVSAWDFKYGDNILISKDYE
jgi:intein/homing endonuclease